MNGQVTPITAAQPQATATFTITALIDGFPVQIAVEGKADALRAMIDRLKAIGAQPPNPQSAIRSPQSSAPLCPTHNTPMKPSRKPGKFYCARKAEDGEYCREVA